MAKQGFGRGDQPPVGRSGPVISETNNFRDAHKQSDVDSEPSAQHHTLGLGPEQAFPGNAGKALQDFRNGFSKNRIAYTPVASGFSVGAGTVQGHYVDLGPFFWFRAVATLGVGFTMPGTTPQMTMPFVSDSSGFAIFNGGPRILFYDSSYGGYEGIPALSGSICQGYAEYIIGGVPGVAASPTATYPFTWVSGDSLIFSGFVLKHTW